MELAFLGINSLIVNQWLRAVNHAVTQPYLDEVFHIRQAQHYCNGDFEIWDPKITTPPGIYLLSSLVNPLFGCSISALRGLNAVGLIALLVVLRVTYIYRRQANNAQGHLGNLLTAHSALNMALFPPLFFFSALYYTDVVSTLSVAVFYCYFIRTISNGQTSFVQGSVQVLLGLISLCFRQTNIFWVAIGPAALVLILQLDKGHHVVKGSMYRRAQGFGDTTFNIAKTSWKMEVVYDPPVRDAYFEDYLRTIVSIVACACKAATQPRRIVNIVLALAPYLTLVGCFGAFVVWNGGVVLGDKSNHIATINLPQMLYLWPFFAFFSWPLLLPHFFLLPLTLLSRVGEITHLEPLLVFRRRYFLPRLSLLVAFTVLASVIVHFNTVVHPFLLADNRHYHFYIFRRLLRPWWMRYAVTPIYVVTAWACLETRGEPAPSAKKATGVNHVAANNVAKGPAVVNAYPAKQQAIAYNRAGLPDGTSSSNVSFTLISLITTALSLCTAPLVEPRYCIIPYIMWRMHLPLHSIDEPKNRKPKSWRALVERYDWRVAVETVWLLLINAVTAYIFLNWGFVWPQEPKSVQRFMW